MDLLLYPVPLLSVFLLIPTVFRGSQTLLELFVTVSAQSAINLTNQTEVPMVTSPTTLSSNTMHVAGSATTPTTAQPMTDVTSSPVLSPPGNASCDNKSPTSSPRLSCPNVRSSAQAKIPSTPSQDTAAGPVLGSTAAATATTSTSVTSPEGPKGTHTDIPPTQSPGKSLTMLAFGVMTLILILIIIMVVLVTVVNLKDKCSNSKEEGKKSSDSVVSESNVTFSGEKESITLISMKTINTETDTDSPQVSSIHSTTLDYEEQEQNRDLLNNKLV
ncbi:endothelial cell-specific chemotaxis regulator isoform X3 [Oncorhynchus tshawytscha]|uniref:endothelial cell-specific chemotaxis regulator isoform X3 n=1 Tax=Oncorhynchus tshawytscha TaxID=74940 RepID=UPI000D0990F4|nr:endothelial cell-specific chemotaxis regulator isoform X3 [Oncorhynchus tshawytscha]